MQLGRERKTLKRENVKITYRTNYLLVPRTILPGFEYLLVLIKIFSLMHWSSLLFLLNALTAHPLNEKVNHSFCLHVSETENLGKLLMLTPSCTPTEPTMHTVCLINVVLLLCRWIPTPTKHYRWKLLSDHEPQCMNPLASLIGDGPACLDTSGDRLL